MGELAERLNRLPPGSRIYRLQVLPNLLANASQVDRLYNLLTNFDFIEAKVYELGSQPLIEDYDLASAPDVLLSGEKADSLRLIQSALQLSAHVLERDKTQLAGQLLGRLLSHQASPPFWQFWLIIGRLFHRKSARQIPKAIQSMLEQAKQWKITPWLRPLTPSLTQAGGSLQRIIIGHASWLSAVAVTPDGQWALSGSFDGTLKLWDVRRGTEQFTLTGHTGLVIAAAMTPDRQWAVSGSDDETLKLWDLQRGIHLKTLTGHTSEINAVAVTPDGKKAISASDDGTLKLWDLVRGCEHCTLTGHVGSVNAVAMTPNGRWALSGSYDNTVKLWNLYSGRTTAL